MEDNNSVNNNEETGDLLAEESYIDNHFEYAKQSNDF